MSRSAGFLLVLVLAAGTARAGMETYRLFRHGELRDFASYYTAAVLAREGRPFYDPQLARRWFEASENADLIATARRLGLLHAHPAEGYEHVHQYSYPPAMMFVTLPLAWLPLGVARGLWLALSWLLLVLGAWIVMRTLAVPPFVQGTMAIVALGFEPVWSTLGLGQINILIFFLLAVCFALIDAGRGGPAGIVLGAAVAVRVHPALLVLHWAWRRRFAAAGIAAIVVGVITALAVVAFGVEPTMTYFTGVGPKYTAPPPSLTNHSLHGFVTAVAHALGYDPNPGVTRLIAVVSAALVVVVTAWVMGGGAPVADARTSRLEFALVVLAIPLAVTTTTSNHLVSALIAIWIALAVMLDEASAPPRVAWVALLAGTLIVGVLDDYYYHPMLFRGALVFLAEIKTYGLVLLYVAVAATLRHVRTARAVA